MKFITAAATLLVLLDSNCVAEDPLQLSVDNYKAWMQHIQPTEAELKWNQIDWQPDLPSGIAKAAQEGKPILLWTMNGHPFGCT